jgi:hypothetical protein
MTGGRLPAELRGTPVQQLVFLNTYWGSKYTFAAPQARGGPWTATATFGGHDQLQGSSAAELLEKVRGHYKANRSQDSRGGDPS